MDLEQHLSAVVEHAVLSALRPSTSAGSDSPSRSSTRSPRAAGVLQVSEDTMGRLVRRGVLAKLPHLESGVLIPRTQVDRLIADAERSQNDVRRSA